MNLASNIQFRIRFLFWGISICLWFLLFLNPGSIMSMAHVHLSDARQVTFCGPFHTKPLDFKWQMLFSTNSIAKQIVSWTLMVLAMMLPKLIGMVELIVARSLKNRRVRSSFLFLSGYTSIWVLVGCIMMVLSVALSVLFPASYIPALIIALIAFLWQCSPAKQYCLIQSHNITPLAAFGWRADRDALRFGIRSGLWCAGSGWALMLFPMQLHVGHMAAMLAVTVLMFSEHMDHPKLPQWRINFSGKLLRASYSQAVMSWKRRTWNSPLAQE